MSSNIFIHLHRKKCLPCLVEITIEESGTEPAIENRQPCGNSCLFSAEGVYPAHAFIHMQLLSFFNFNPSNCALSTGRS